MPLAPDDFKVADLSLAGFGRKEIQLAEHEMPGLMATRAEFADAQPLAGAKIMGSLHMTIQTAVLIETLKALGAEAFYDSDVLERFQAHEADIRRVAGSLVMLDVRADPIRLKASHFTESPWRRAAR